MLLALNGYLATSEDDDAVELMLGVGAGNFDEEVAEAWIRDHLAPTA